MRALKPFWIYWGILMLGCILFFIFPLILFVFFSVMILILPLWFVTVYLIGMGVQKRSRLPKAAQRMVLAFLCSLVSVLIFPMVSWIYDILRWHTIHIGSLIQSLNDWSLWIVFAVHSAAFWAGEETERLSSGQSVF